MSAIALTAFDWDRAALWRFRAAPLRVIDGDTLVVLCDTGFYGRHEVHIRLAGYSAPELDEDGGPEAHRRLQYAVFANVALTLWPLRVTTLQRETVISEVRSFERYVGMVLVMLPDGTLQDIVERVQP